MDNITIIDAVERRLGIIGEALWKASKMIINFRNRSKKDTWIKAYNCL